MKNVILFFFLPFTLCSQDLTILNCEDTSIGLDRYCQAWVEVEYGATTSCAESLIDWHIFVDMWDDGTIDYFLSPDMDIRSTYTPIPKFLGNGDLNPAFEGLPEGFEYSDVVYTNGIAPTASGEIGKINIEVVDGEAKVNVYKKAFTECGEMVECSHEILIRDISKPKVITVDHSTALVNGCGQVEFHAIDFIKESSDDCTLWESLIYTFLGVLPQLNQITIEQDGESFYIDRYVSHYFDKDGFVDFNSNGITPATNGVIYPKTKDETLRSYRKGDRDHNVDALQLWTPDENSSSIVINFHDFQVDLSISCVDEAGNMGIATTLMTALTHWGADFSTFIFDDNGELFEQEFKILFDNKDEDVSHEFIGKGGSFFIGGWGNPYIPFGEYTLSIESDASLRNGVSTLDLVYIMRHIMGIAIFDDVYQVIASDVNEDDAITPEDLIALRNIILNIPTPELNPYKFFNREQVFIDPQQPWPLEETIDIINNNEECKDIRFTAVKLGDVNGTAMKTRRGETVNFIHSNDQELTKGEIIELPLTMDSKEMIFALEAHLSMEGLEYIGPSVFNNQLYLNVEHDNLHLVGTIPTGIHTEELVNLPKLKFKVTKNVRLSEAITMIAEQENIVYVGDDLEGVKLQIDIRRNSNQMDLNVYPNPVTERSIITFYTEQSGDAMLKLTDMHGRTIDLSSTIKTKEGLNSVEVDSLLSVSPGIYLLSIVIEGNREMVKIVVP